MTCVVGLIDTNGVVHIGADSLAGDTARFDVHTRTKPKVFKNGEFVIGFTDSFRMADLLQHSLKPPPITGDMTAYMSTKFVDAVRKCFEKGGYAGQDDKDKGGTFLVGVRGRLFYVGCDFQVGESSRMWQCIGCGADYANGAMWALEYSGKIGRITPERAIRYALMAAEECCAFVRGPFNFVSTR